MISNSYQHIVILNDRTYLCTCLLLVSHGVICHHYFKLIVKNPNALFHIMLMLTRWLQDNAWNCIDSIFNEPFIRTLSKNLKQSPNDGIDQKTYLVSRYYDSIQEEIRTHYHIQKKLDYGQIMEYFKQVLNYSLDDDD